MRFEAVGVLAGNDERAEIEAPGRDITMGQKRPPKKRAPFVRAFPDPTLGGKWCQTFPDRLKGFANTAGTREKVP